MPSDVDKRRLRDGARALALPEPGPGASVEALKQYSVMLFDAIVAMQSLDDLGPEGNKKAMDDHDELHQRWKRTQQRLREIAN